MFISMHLSYCVMVMKVKEEASKTQLMVDLGLHGGVIPANCGTGDITRLLDEGVTGFKVMM